MDTIHTFQPNVHLPITLGTELLIELVDFKQRIKSSLIGMENNRYLIVKLSSKDFDAGFTPEAVKQSPMIIRYLFRGSVYGFKTSVLHTISEPSRLVFVTYPQKIEEFNVRNNPRYQCILPAEIEYNGEAVEMVIVDISQKGCRCVVRTHSVKNREQFYSFIDIDREIGINVQFPGVEDKLRLASRVRNINKDNDRVIFGVLFEETEEEAAGKRLDSFISLISEIDKGT